jgi:hypothetical protein
MIPVTIIAATVIAGRPPICFEISIPMGVVTDFGTRELVMVSSSPKKPEKMRMLEIPAMQPALIPAIMGKASRLRS